MMRDKKHCQRYLRNWNSCALLVAMHAGAATVENGVEVPRDTKDGAVVGSSTSIIIQYLRILPRVRYLSTLKVVERSPRKPQVLI